MSSSKQVNCVRLPIGLKRMKKRKIRNLKWNHIVLYLEKVTSDEKFSRNLTLDEVQIVRKIQRFNAVDGSIETLKKLLNFQKF